VLTDPGETGGPVVIPNGVQIVLNWALADGRPAHNVMYGRAGGIPAPNAAQAEAIRVAITSGINWTNFAGGISTTTSLTGVSLRSVHSANAALFTSTGAAVSGTNVSVALPNETALCVTLRTALSGKANRGRIYLPGHSVDQITAGNLINPGAVTNAQVWVNGFFSAFTGSGYTWSIGQKARQAYTGTTGTSHPARNAGLVDVESVIVRDNHWDSQRRRGLK
jgi:hypothetical protein